MTSINERFSRLDTFISEDRLVRKEWGDGQERACLLLAIAPEVGQGAVERCSAGLLPVWLAHLTPALDDGVSMAAWPAMVRRYSAVVRMGAETLDDAGWRRVQARFLLAVLGEATAHDPSESCQRVSALWARVLTGDEPSKQEWSSSAQKAWKAAAWAAKEAAWAAKEAASASEASEAASCAASLAAASTTWAAAASARAAAWDRMARALFAAIEAECGEHRRKEDK